MTNCVDTSALGVWFLRALLMVMTASSLVAGTLVVMCWRRRHTGHIWGILGRQYTAKMLRSFMLGVVLYNLPPAAAITTLSGFQLAWLAVEMWSAVTLWELGIWLIRRK